MAKWYVEINAENDKDLAAVMSSLHVQIGQRKEKGVGLTFPQYQYDTYTKEGQVGNTVRVFGENKSQLTDLVKQAFVNLIDHRLAPTGSVAINPCQPVPENVKQYVCFYRIQKKSASTRRREAAYAVSQGRAKTLEEALAAQAPRRLISEPSVRMASFSSNKEFIMAIGQKRSPRKKAAGGEFTTYGLSRGNAPVYLPVF